VLTFAFAVLADRAVSHWAPRADLDPAVDTRVRFIRRLITLGICVLGVLFARSQFGGLNKLAAGLLASSAIIAAIVGFAARQTLANLIAGVMLVVAQPLRIGDRVTIQDQTGVAEDVRLNYTVLRSAEGRRLLIPNDRLASEMIRNDTILDDRVRPEASVWRQRRSRVAPFAMRDLRPAAHHRWACSRSRVGRYWRAMCSLSSASGSLISSPLRSTVTVCSVPLKRNGVL
jgi:mechanosensitive ion channel-like protein